MITESSPHGNPSAAPVVTGAMLTTVARAMVSMRDDASASRLAELFLARWAAATETARLQFLDDCATSLGPSEAELTAAAIAYLDHPDPRNGLNLFDAAISGRQRAFSRINSQQGGLRVLIEMRELILRSARTPNAEGRTVVDRELAYLLTSWLSTGSLTFREINWQSPAALVERVIKYESVHEIRDWNDLRRRLQRDRRCYGFFHVLLEDEPIIFVEIALTHGLSSSIHDILGPDELPDTSDARCAIFYSISNCHEGLRGIPFGGLLLKQAINVLRHEFAQLTQFATLSPIPGFAAWLKAQHPAEYAALRAPHVSAEAHRAWLMHLCARYLTGRSADGRPLDAVARFHLGNGARVARINWNADQSPKGMSQSFGMMVNYEYALDQLEENVEALVNGAVIAADESVVGLASSPPPAFDATS